MLKLSDLYLKAAITKMFHQANTNPLATNKKFKISAKKLKNQTEIIELKNTTEEILKACWMCSILRVEMTEGRIRELEARSTEFIQSEQHRRK